MPDELISKDLRKRFESFWSGQPPDAEWYREGEEPALRIWRAISWVKRAEQETDDWDAKFIFYWIAFNAAYAQYVTPEDSSGEKSCFEEYFKTVISLDRDSGSIFNTVWSGYSDLIRNFLDNRFVFQKFWNHHNPAHICGNYRNHGNCDDWENSFERKKRIVRSALGKQDTITVLSILFERLYTLRNQLIHGGSSWSSKIIRNQSRVRNGTSIMEALVPNLIHVMMEGDDPDIWGPSHYPRITLEQLGLGPDEEFPAR